MAKAGKETGTKSAGTKSTASRATRGGGGRAAKGKVSADKPVASGASVGMGAGAAASAVASAPMTGSQGQSMGQSTDQTFSPEEHYRMVQDAAYHIAEKDGFQHGRETDYWLQAERQIEEMLRSHDQGQASSDRSGVH